jgi:hypothetical protein
VYKGPPAAKRKGEGWSKLYPLPVVFRGGHERAKEWGVVPANSEAFRLPDRGRASRKADGNKGGKEPGRKIFGLRSHPILKIRSIQGGGGEPACGEMGFGSSPPKTSRIFREKAPMSKGF